MTRAQTEDAESDGRKIQAEQSRDGPIDWVAVQGGLNHFLHGGKQLANLEPVDQIVWKKTESFVQEGQVHFEDGQLLEVEVDKVRVDVHILLLLIIEDFFLE